MLDKKLTQRDEDVKNFFSQNGFTHSWDFNSKTGEIWNEFYLNGKLICQIDIGVPLECLIEDLKCWKAGKEPTSSHDYMIFFGENKKNLQMLLDNLKLPD